MEEHPKSIEFSGIISGDFECFCWDDVKFIKCSGADDSSVDSRYKFTISVERE